MKKPEPPKPQKQQSLPTRPALLEFIRDNPQAGKKDIAKAFGLQGAALFALNTVLEELKEDGISLGRPRKKRDKGARAEQKEAKLPPIAVLDIVARDKDGVLLARLHDSRSPPHKAAAPAAKGKHAAKARGRRISAEESPLIALAFSPSVPCAGVGAHILAKIFPAKGEDKQTAPYQGRIIRLLSKQPVSLLGIVRPMPQGHFRLEPINRKQAELLLDDAGLNGAQADDLVLAEPVTDGGRAFSARFGRVKQIIGHIAEEKALSAIALYSHNIPTEFPAEVLAEAARAARQKPQGKREDWRHIPFITIDPETAKDHDDAVFAESDSDPRNIGGHHIFIAIADVAAYVRPGTAMDNEARKRGNSVYFPDRVVPMLPEDISNNLCSLREGEDRPALAVKITLDAQGGRRQHKFHRIVMRSRAKLSYEQAQAAIDADKEPQAAAPLPEAVLKPLWAAYHSLRQAREKRQPLELNLPERKLILDAHGRVIDIRVITRLDAHRLIEEFMIAANIAAAETLKKNHTPLLFRIHDTPALAKQEGLKEFLLTLGIKLSSGAALTAEQLNGILAKAKDRDYEELVNSVVLRAQAQAEYSPLNIGHFGLKLPNYAHFTSPIRRYADLLAHRGLIKALKLGADGLTEGEEADLEHIAAEISAAERRAQLAERETNDRLIAYYLSAHVGAQFSSRINGVTRAGLFVTLDRSGADGFVPIAALKDAQGVKDYYSFDEAHFALIGARSRMGFQLGAAVEVRLLNVQKAAGSLRFEMLSPPQKLPFAARSFRKAPHGKKPQRPALRKHRGRKTG